MLPSSSSVNLFLGVAPSKFPRDVMVYGQSNVGPVDCRRSIFRIGMVIRKKKKKLDRKTPWLSFICAVFLCLMALRDAY